MGFDSALKRPLHLIRSDPTILLPASLVALSFLVWAPGLWWIAKQLEPIWNASNANVSTFLTEHVAEIFPLLPAAGGFFVFALLVTGALKAWLSLVFTDVAGQPNQKPISLILAFESARPRFWPLFVAIVIGAFLVFSSFIAAIVLLGIGLAALAIPILGVLVLIVAILFTAVAGIVIVLLGSAGFLYLPSVIRFTDKRGFDAVRAAWDFAWNAKLESIMLIVIIAVVSSLLGQVAQAAMPAFWLVFPLSFLTESIVLGWSGLTAASTYLESKPTLKKI